MNEVKYHISCANKAVRKYYLDKIWANWNNNIIFVVKNENVVPYGFEGRSIRKPDY